MLVEFRPKIRSDYNEATSSSDSTWAFVARLRARVQSPSRSAERASVMKPFIFEARSDCVEFNCLPCERERFDSATLRLVIICCRASFVSAGLSCGAIAGGSGLAATLLSRVGSGATCGRAGTADTANKAGGGGSSNRNSGTGSILSSAGGAGRGTTIAGMIGRTTAAPCHVVTGRLCDAHPPIRYTTPKQTTSHACACLRDSTEQCWGLFTVII